jgi:hypothetical protein
MFGEMPRLDFLFHQREAQCAAAVAHNQLLQLAAAASSTPQHLQQQNLPLSLSADAIAALAAQAGQSELGDDGDDGDCLRHA